MPFRYGIATMTEFPLLFLNLTFDLGRGIGSGVSSDLLPPKWFTKVAERDPVEEIDEMVGVIERAIQMAYDVSADSPFEFWEQLYRRQEAERESSGLAPLLVHFGTSLVERALIDAFARFHAIPFHRMLASNGLGIQLGRLHGELEGMLPSELLPSRPLERVYVRHTIGLGDPLEAGMIPPAERVDDGLPQALADCIRAYGLKHFKVKISGELAVDLPRLEALSGLLDDGVGEEGRFSLDGNEQFLSWGSFYEYWMALCVEPWFERFWSRLLFVEQPLHRQVALTETVDGMGDWGGFRPELVIDESDGDMEALPRALALGYQGTSHKNCKGVFKGIANRCLIEKRNRTGDRPRYRMSGEDLCNQGPVSLLQDLAVMSSLGIESVERNGHHYCRGMAAHHRDAQRDVKRHHLDLYTLDPSGLLTLRIEGGQVRLQSVNDSPFGVGFALDTKPIPSVSSWRASRG